VIVQQINLYQDRFKEKRQWLSATNVISVAIVLATGLAVYGYWLQVERDQSQQRGLVIAAEQQKMASEISAANAELSSLLADNRVEKDIESVAREILARKKVLSFVNSNQFGSGEGFSSYLVALAELRVEKIWLNRIELAQGYLHIKGSSLKAELVPEYFRKFSSKEIFHGKQFDLFELKRAGDSGWKIDFDIATKGDDGE